ncbi:MAG: acetate--CoA ligase family protein [Desulfobacterales bacterium]|nr:acetate--CoA ligase family protein [Desulfobacterales bacterium]
MHKLFYPERIAVIGVSKRQANAGRNIMENIVRFDFAGDVFPVGHHGGTVCGREILTSVDRLPAGIDEAIIITPAATVPDIVDQCGRKGIPWVIVETGGFGELSADGKKLGDELISTARKWGIRVVGPNGLGIINMGASLVTPFAPMHKEILKQGPVAVLAQSGGVMYNLVNQLSNNNIGVSKAVSFGNKLDLDEIDYLSYLIEDDETRIILLYLESITRGRELMELAAKTTKPIVIQKVNRYPATSEIAMFHTQALASDDRVVDAAFREAGIVRAHSYREAIDWVKILTLPPMRGNSLVIIARSGGVAISAADFATEYKFTFYPLSEAFLNKVQEKSGPNVIKRTNPLDLGDFFNFDLFVGFTEDALKEGADGIFFQHGGATKDATGMISLGKAFHRLSIKYQKPISACFMFYESNAPQIRRSFELPLFADPQDAIRALAVSRDHYRQIREREDKGEPPQFSFDRDTIEKNLRRAGAQKRPLLLKEALEIVGAAGIPCARCAVCRDVDEALAHADEIGYPIGLKINCPSLLHKVDIGVVARNIQDRGGLKEAFAQLTQQARKQGFNDGILIQGWVSHGMEMILGGTVDNSFGPVGMLGFGGSYAEIFGDTVLRILPLTEKKADTMLTELRGYPLLKGVRGFDPFDCAQLKEALLRLSQLMIAFEEIKGIDVNPLFVLPQGQGVVAVDVRLITSS